MKKPFSKKVIDEITPTDKRQSAFDTVYPGLALLITPTGVKTFYFCYRTGKGRSAVKKWVMLGRFPKMTVEQARAKAKEVPALVTAGKDPAAQVQEDKKALTVAEALDGWQQEHFPKLKPKSVKLYEVVVRLYLKPTIGKTKVKAICYSDVARLHASMQEKPYMANRCIAVLAVFLDWCERHGYRDKHTNPCKDFKLFKEHERKEFMGAIELAILGETLARMEQTWRERKASNTRRPTEIEHTDTITPHSAAAIRLLMFTGARLMEVLSLKWNQVDLDLGTARLPDSKTGFKVLQLPAPALTVLRDLPQISEYVFPAESQSGHMTSLQIAWVNVLKQSGLTGWRLHDLRHAFASMMVNSGASLPIVGKILGHTQASTTQRYAHLEENPARKAAEAAAAKIAKAMSTPGGKKVVPFAKTGNASA